MHRDQDPDSIGGRHGIYDLRHLHISRHALDRFCERVTTELDPDETRPLFVSLLGTCRKLGTNEQGAVASLIMYEDEPLVIIVNSGNVVTLLSLAQFETVMHEFGRHSLPRRLSRWLRKLQSNATQTKSNLPTEPN